MKIITTSIITFFLLASCSTAPEPLVFGKDGCFTCKMTLMDNKYGAEIVTKKGKVYKFDDLNCLMNFYKADLESEENIAHILVIDFANPEQLIDAQRANYVQAEQIRSPMASHVAAFDTSESLEKFNAEWNGKEMNWSELQEKLK